MDLKLPKMLCKDSKQHHVMFHELNSVSSLLCIAQNVRFEIPYKVLYFETPFLMIFKYYAWASYGFSLAELVARVIFTCIRYPLPPLGSYHRVLSGGGERVLGSLDPRKFFALGTRSPKPFSPGSPDKNADSG